MLPLPPPIVELVQLLPSLLADPREGISLEIGGESVRSPWRWQDGNPARVWLPIDLLERRFGVRQSPMPGGGLRLESYGWRQDLPASALVTLQDEVGIDASDLLERLGARVIRPWGRGDEGRLRIDWSPAVLTGIRRGPGPVPARIVLDLATPTPISRSRGRDGGRDSLRLRLQAPDAAVAALRQQGVAATLEGDRLVLPLDGWQALTLGDPARIVLDRELPGSAPAVPTGTGAQGPSVQRRLLSLEGRSVRMTAVAFDPRRDPFQLVPLSRRSMEGLSSLASLARNQRAVAALNGGFFNRIRALPLGGLKDQGDWLSGPILGRGGMAWKPGELPRFGRMRLQEWLEDDQGRRWPLAVLNSGFVQQGLARYTALWGPAYRAISGRESGVLLEGERVVDVLDGERLAAGVPLAPGRQLIVGRAGVVLPHTLGESLRLRRQGGPEGLEELPYGIQAGPLLLRQGQVVLDGELESFSPAFLNQRAPRSVVASDGQRLWLLTLEGEQDAGPTLPETVGLLRRLGMVDALNLDGGSSTSLIVAGDEGSTGRGLGSSIHNGLGLVGSGPR
ncbi:MAG: phosphodiester glycosidase family protein [Cyanobacteriota bacterium]|nr:phosphodiester glycosidase family protein [Cyanobacteriota bacterium]